MQFNRQMGFKNAAAVIDYLVELGIGDYYASPLVASRPGSPHGYDVIDHSRLNPELGRKEEFIEFAAALKDRGMGLIMDVVPNHMCIAGNENIWWNDVLENGAGSLYSRYFDIDWDPPKENLKDKVLLPMLGDQYGRVIENCQLQLSYHRGSFYANYFETRLPIAPRTYILMLKPALEMIGGKLSETNATRLEFESIITALEHLPPRTETDPEKVKERRREKEIIKRRLSALYTANNVVRQAIKQVISGFNGKKGEPRSFDRLEELLGLQSYRLSYWRVAADEINYRRFFDINDLAAIRVEEPEVFASVNELVFRLIKEGVVTGLRIDHIDGLYDPARYLRDLQRGARKALRQAYIAANSVDERPRFRADNVRPGYVVVEKILGWDEQMREGWAAYGTTGYDFLNLLNGLFIDPNNELAFLKIWQRMTGERENFAHVAYQSKKLILRTSMSSEHNVLARKLDRISERDRYWRDFTLNSLRDALGEVIACFPVYRSYIGADQTAVSDEDRRYINNAVRIARRRNPAMSSSISQFMRSLLLLENPVGMSEEESAERRDFVMRFQQLTGPVTAKGVEDTAFYRYHPLASLCEVGGDPSIFGVPVGIFHQRNLERLARQPHTLLATTTHDTKRSEDVRARINVLSEIPIRWYRAIRRWQKLNSELKRAIDDHLIPDVRDEYLLYQTLIGAWPLDQRDLDTSFIKRIQDYMIKAGREAKVYSSWVNPDEEYEEALRGFVERIIAPEHEFLSDFIDFQSALARPGLYNSLSQTLLKIAAPGVPDFYQGTETWNFSLVDPDNRRPVDYAQLQYQLESLRSAEGVDGPALPMLVDGLMRNATDGRIKTFIISRALGYRRNNREIFERGEYLPLSSGGERDGNLVSFARRLGDHAVIVVTARFFTQLADRSLLPLGAEVWGNTYLALPPELSGYYCDQFTGTRVFSVERQGQGQGQEHFAMPISRVFAHLPVALLERVQEK